MRIRVSHEVLEHPTAGFCPHARVLVGNECFGTFAPRHSDELVGPGDFAGVVAKEAHQFAQEMRRMLRARHLAYFEVLGLSGWLRYRLYPALYRWKLTFWTTATMLLLVLLLGAPMYVPVTTLGIFMFVEALDGPRSDHHRAPRVTLVPELISHSRSHDRSNTATLRAVFFSAEGEKAAYASDEVLDERNYAAMPRSALESLLPSILSFEMRRDEKRRILQSMKTQG